MFCPFGKNRLKNPPNLATNHYISGVKAEKFSASIIGCANFFGPSISTSFSLSLGFQNTCLGLMALQNNCFS